MKATVLARLASFFLVVALLLPSLDAAAARPGNFGRRGKTSMHRPVYKKYQPGCRWIFQKY
ncbi:hypothetical protein [Hymenobacter jeollabukensis]|uniref:Uncharacterized protein n=1 Tax=Hymenobacter jeollabukensis TaxID=2025313 RepID=A0A5R8WVY9_9BACT|nr:hypothetical protein [Hymenobacter jeollabukensis]TLM96687.1 hypothetical protein FDY95_01450 [Hymenobacter jeollabukensis]